MTINVSKRKKSNKQIHEISPPQNFAELCRKLLISFMTIFWLCTGNLENGTELLAPCY